MAKTLLIGNAAVARGAYEAGVRVVSSYPGTPSTEITESIVKYPDVYVEWAPNEKVACEVAIGSSMAGGRAMTCCKHVGLNVMADPLFTASYIGANAGLRVAVLLDGDLEQLQLRRSHAVGIVVVGHDLVRGHHAHVHDRKVNLFHSCIPR